MSQERTTRRNVNTLALSCEVVKVTGNLAYGRLRNGAYDPVFVAVELPANRSEEIAANATKGLTVSGWLTGSLISGAHAVYTVHAQYAAPGGPVAEDLNHVVLEGNLVEDPKAVETNDGRTFTSFRIAVNTGEETPLFLDVSAFNGVGESVLTYKRKGHRVLVTGRLSPADVWGENQDRVNLRVLAASVQFLGMPAQGRVTVLSQDPFGDEPTPSPTDLVDPEDIPF